MTDSMPLVSVILPAHNAATTIKRALDSIAIQARSDMEVIVLDDASVDGTEDIVKSYSGLNITSVRLQVNLGASAARNKCIELARGKYVAFLDADDEWLPGKTDKQLTEIEKSDAISIVYCEAEVFAPGKVSTGLANKAGLRPTGSDAWKTLLFESCITTSCVMTRLDILKGVGGFKEHLASGEDQDLWIRLALGGDVVYQNETLTSYYLLSNSLSQRARTTSTLDFLSEIENYVEENKEQLTPKERSKILAARTRQAGRVFIRNGLDESGKELLKKARKHGSPVLENINFRIKNTRFVRTLTRGRILPDVDLDNHYTTAEAIKPKLLVVVDTEEEFDWSKPFSRESRAVQNIEYQVCAQKVFEEYALQPTYVVDGAVAASKDAVQILSNFERQGKCYIGAHLHPWVTPPDEEEVNNRNSFPGNLSYDLEYRKLKNLTETIAGEFGSRPVMYKAGRYGLGPNTERILQTLGYSIDLSVVPFTDFSKQEGPDFGTYSSSPFWFGDQLSSYEIPLTREFVGMCAPVGRLIYPGISSPLAKRMKMTGVFARARLLERLTLTPEGLKLTDLKRLIDWKERSGHKLYCVSYHSSSLMSGGSPYVRGEKDRFYFLERLRAMVDYLVTEIGCEPTTPLDIYENALKRRLD